MYTFLTLSIVLLAANQLSELNTSHSSHELEQSNRLTIEGKQVQAR